MDNVKVYEPDATPNPATLLSPADGATDVSVFEPLDWFYGGGTAPTGYRINFGTDNPPTNIENNTDLGLVSIYTPGTALAGFTTYYWEVIPYNVAGDAIGTSVWSFTTGDACPVSSLPVTEDFETSDVTWPPLCWSITGEPGLWDWAGTLPLNGISAIANFADISSGSSDLISLEYDASTATAPKLTFDWAYATYFDDPDELDIYYSTDAGATWVLLQAMPGGLNGILNPFNLQEQTSYYFPSSDQWSTLTLDLPANTNKVKFTAITAWGNLLWLDNIRITGTEFVDNFDSYTAGNQLACSNPTDWTTWSLLPCDLVEDAYISSNYALSSPNSVVIAQGNDLVYLTGLKTEGKWYASFAVYIPAGKVGYFNAQQTFTVDWGVEVFFDGGGAGRVENGASVPFVYQEDNWNQCLLIVDLNTSTAEFWFGANSMTQKAVWDWTRGGTQPNTLEGFDWYGASVNDEAYFDDFRFSDLAPPIIQPLNEVGTFSIDMDYQYAPGTVVPMATVKNYGTGTNSFDVVMKIDGLTHSTQTVTALAGGATEQVTFDNWTPTTVGGVYAINVCTQLTGDEDPTNDCQDWNVTVWDPDGGDWTAGTDFPSTAYNGVGVTYNDGTTNWLFVMGGNTPSTLGTECYKYNVTADTWTAIAPLPAKRLIMAGAVVGDYIYVIGGSDGTAYTTTTLRYDIAGDTWSTMADVPTTIGWCRAVGYLDNYIYLAGGYDGVGLPYLSSVYLYDVTANTWTLTTNPMPHGVFGGAFGLTGDNTTLVYAGGALESGITNTVVTGTIDGGNPALITWVTMDNTYPGIGNDVRGKYDPDQVLAEMLTQSTDAVKHITDGAIFPAGSIYRTHAATWGSDAIIMAGGTPTSDYVAADPSPCYIYTPSTDTWLAQENVPVSIGAHQSGSVHDGSTWKFIIASGFGVDSTESETQIYTKDFGGGTTFALAVDVMDGWNMVSVPGTNPAGMGVDTWWPSRNALADVYKWTGTYSSVTTTATTEGYWMLHTGANTYNYPAIEIVAHDPIAISTGWNMIGGYDNSALVSGLTTSPPNLIVAGTVYGWNGTYFNPTNLVPGYGYWLLSTGDGVINPPTLAKGTSKLVAQDNTENWGKITITDATGKNYVLYAVDGKVNLESYQLPPLPPTGTFDVRYSSGKKAEKFDKETQTIEMRGITYPVKVRAEKMGIRIQDETGKIVNERLKAGEEIMINNSLVSKLNVSADLIPVEYALEQNYPNPFNPSTKIEFSLPEDVNNVTLTIYNALGQRVAELINSNMEAGYHSFVWNASNVATGMYIYELRTDKFVSVKKMMLMK